MIHHADDPVKAHVILQRYEASLRRAYNQALTQLRVTQNNRKREAKEREQFFQQAKQDATDQIYAELAAIPHRRAPQLAENAECDSNPIAPVPALPNGDPEAA